MTVNRFGPFSMVSGPLATRIAVRAGDTIQTVTTGIVGFGGSIGGWLEPILTADGDPVTAPPDYPAPQLRKNSLICEIGGRYFQGGTNSTFVSTRDGEMSLRANDRYPADNHGGWLVRVVQTTVDGPTINNVPRLAIAWMELVQVVQNRAGQVPLIAGKRTILRVFLSSGLGATVDVGSGPGRLAPVDGVVTVRSGSASRALAFRGGVALAPGTHRRDDAGHSLQLEIPLDLMTGQLQLDVTATVRGHAATEAGFTATASRTFPVANNRREKVLPILLRNSRGGMPAPSIGDYTALLRGAMSMLPIPERGPTVNPALTMDAGNIDFNAGFDWSVLLARLATVIWLFPDTPRDGIRTAVVNAPRGAWGGLGISIPWGTFISRTDFLAGNDDDWQFGVETFAHEWMHAYGQLHANRCNAGWPHDDRLSTRTGDAGWDTRSGMLRPSSTSELMSYCPSPRWPSVACYQTAVNALR